MKRLYTLILMSFLLSCNSNREIKKVTDKNFQYVVQKYLDEYEKEYTLLQEELSESDSKHKINPSDSSSTIKYEEALNKYINFTSSETTLKKIRSALEKKESLKIEQIEELERMLKIAKKD